MIIKIVTGHFSRKGIWMNRQGLCIGNKTAALPLIQGGMGVGVSLSGLAGAVALYHIAAAATREAVSV